MGKIQKFTAENIRKIVGGRDPLRIVEDFITKRGFDPDKCEKERTNDRIRWMVVLPDGEELEIVFDNYKKVNEATVYLGCNVAAVDLRRTTEMLVSALEVADGLIGVKLSLVGHYLVLSACTPAQTVSIEELEYSFELIREQEDWFRMLLAQEMEVEEIPKV